MNSLPRYFDFENIQLVPRKCVVYSRKECDPSVQLGPRTFAMPIVPANMVTIIDEGLAIEFAKQNYFYIMHRFNIDSFHFVQKMHDHNLYASISLGIKDYDYELVDHFKKAQLIPEYITIDVAHAHSERVIAMVHYLKKHLPQAFLIVGNIATVEAAVELTVAGADALKVGIGPGRVCTTKLKTGFGTAGWQLSAVHEIAQTVDVPVMLDGGIRYPGDIAKAIHFGAVMCMAGILLSGFKQSPGALVRIEGAYFKEYYGSASFFNKKTKINIEGKKELIPLKGDLWQFLVELKQDIQSAISYGGGRKLSDLKKVDHLFIPNRIQ